MFERIASFQPRSRASRNAGGTSGNGRQPGSESASATSLLARRAEPGHRLRQDFAVGTRPVCLELGLDAVVARAAACRRAPRRRRARAHAGSRRSSRSACRSSRRSPTGPRATAASVAETQPAAEPRLQQRFADAKRLALVAAVPTAAATASGCGSDSAPPTPPEGLRRFPAVQADGPADARPARHSRPGAGRGDPSSSSSTATARRRGRRSARPSSTRIRRLGKQAPNAFLPEGDRAGGTTPARARGARTSCASDPAALARTGADPDRIAIGGITMGGFGALDPAARSRSASARSAATRPRSSPAAHASIEFGFDDAVDFAKHDLLESRVTVRPTAGRSGSTSAGGRVPPRSPPAARELEADGANISFHMSPGAHTGEYGDAHFARVPALPRRCLRLGELVLEAANTMQALWPPKPNEFETPTRHVGLARLVRDVVEVALGIGLVVVDRRRQHAASTASIVKIASTAPAAPRQCPVAPFVEETGVLSASPRRARASGFRLRRVAERRRRPVRVDVVDLVASTPASRSAISSPAPGSPVRIGLGDVVRVGGDAVARSSA